MSYRDGDEMRCRCEGGSGPLCSDCVEYEEAKRQRRYIIRLHTSGFPSSLRNLGLRDAAKSTPSSAFAAAASWTKGDLPGLCLTGNIGVGKTYLAACAAAERLRHRPVRWVSAAHLMAKLRQDFNSTAKQEADSIVGSSGAVVLDDINKVNPTKYGREVMFAVIDSRIQEGSPVLVTMDCDLERIGDLLGDAIKSRLASFTVVRMTGEDRRLHA